MRISRHRHIYLLFLSAVLFFCGCGHGTTYDTVQGDSLYSAAHIEAIAFAQPKEALALLDTAEARKLLTPFDISRLRCYVYHNGESHYRTALFHGRKAYADPDARRHPKERLTLLSLMAEECHNNGDYAGSVDYCAEGLELARELEDRTTGASLHVTWGLNLLEMEQYDKAFAQIDLAIGILEEETRKKPCYHTWNELFYALGMKLSLLWDKDRYDEAIALRPRIEVVLQGLEDSKDTPEGNVDMRRAETDVSYCCIAYTTGDRARGDSLRRRVEENPYTLRDDGEYLRIPCLLLAGHYDEALHYLKREKRLLQETTDTVNWDYIDPHLQMELEIYQGKGDWQAAARVLSTMSALKDTLRQRERHEDALELAEIYKTNEQASLIERQGASIRTRNVVILAAAVFLLGAVVFIIRILRHNRIVKQKNEAMSHTIDELMSYKDELFIRQEENIRLRDKLQQLRDAQRQPDPEKADLPDESASKEDAADCPAPELTERDRALYDRITHEIMTRKLFLNPNFSKSGLIKEIHVPANKFATLFKQFAGCSFSQYIQECRLDHAIRLMREHPQWSMEAVAKEAQMSKTSFYRQFQKKYSMNPSNYLENEPPIPSSE